MKKEDREALMFFPIILIIGFLIALAGSQNGVTYFDFPLFGILVGLAFLIQWLVFFPSYFFKIEKFYDLTGSLTYISLTLLAIFLSSTMDSRSILLAILVIIWAARLGSFLFIRIKKAGKDDRFDEWITSFPRFLNVWNLQALWVTFTSASALIGITSNNRSELGLFAVVGLIVWIIGFSIEVVADSQKRRFKYNPKNDGKFISTGLWSKSRHPNYFGEIVLWLGVTIITLPVLQGWQWIALITPVFVALLLIKVSGIPLLEKKADKKWGGQDDYENYKKNTPVLIPRL